MGNYQEGSSPMGTPALRCFSRGSPLRADFDACLNTANNVAELKRLLDKLERGEPLAEPDMVPMASTSASDIDVE